MLEMLAAVVLAADEARFLAHADINQSCDPTEASGLHHELDEALATVAHTLFYSASTGPFFDWLF